MRPERIPDPLAPRRRVHRDERPRGALRRRPTVQPSNPVGDDDTVELGDQLEDPRSLRTRRMGVQKPSGRHDARVIRGPQQRRDRLEIAGLPRTDHETSVSIP